MFVLCGKVWNICKIRFATFHASLLFALGDRVLALVPNFSAAILSQLMMTSSNGNIFSVTGPLCGEFTDEFSAQRPVTRSFDIFFDLRLNKRLSKQSWGWWSKAPSRPLWRHCNVPSGYKHGYAGVPDAGNPTGMGPWDTRLTFHR